MKGDRRTQEPGPRNGERPSNGPFVEPDRLQAKARQVLLTQLGGTEDGVVDRFALGATGLLGEQTHYSEGFAVLITLEQGVAAAARRNQAGNHRVIFSGESSPWQPHDELPYYARVVLETANVFSGDMTVDIAMANSLTPSCFDGYVAALGASTYRCMLALQDRNVPEASPEEIRQLTEALHQSTELPFSPAYPIAALHETPYELELIDTATLEHLPVQVEGGENLSWAMFDVGMGAVQGPEFHRHAKEVTLEAIAFLKENGFRKINSFRELEHRDLQRAMGILPERLQPIARHLVTENRRVQKLVRAARQEDWQFFGALLFMSHASLRTVWGSTREELDFVVEQAENLSMEGVYGACQTGRGGCVLVAGQPYTLPGAVRQIKRSYQESFDRPVDVLLL